MEDHGVGLALRVLTTGGMTDMPLTRSLQALLLCRRCISARQVMWRRTGVNRRTFLYPDPHSVVLCCCRLSPNRRDISTPIERLGLKLRLRSAMTQKTKLGRHAIFKTVLPS